MATQKRAQLRDVGRRALECYRQSRKYVEDARQTKSLCVQIAALRCADDYLTDLQCCLETFIESAERICNEESSATENDGMSAADVVAVSQHMQKMLRSNAEFVPAVREWLSEALASAEKCDCPHHCGSASNEC